MKDFPDQYPEWSYRQDDLGVVYCLGRAISPYESEATAVYYQTESDEATKQTLDGSARYSRLIYQGLPEEHQRLIDIERPDVIGRLQARTSQTGTDIILDPTSLISNGLHHRSLTTWLESDHPMVQTYQKTLHIACAALAKSGVILDELSLYGAASFGLVGTTDKVVDDIDVLFKAANIAELREATQCLATKFTWADIDPHGRLPERRQRLKAKRWATSQIRMDDPYPLSIDLKVERDPALPSLWGHMPKDQPSRRFSGRLRVLDDTEGFSISPALRCEDRSGNERIVLMKGYQYIGSAVVGDTIIIEGTAYQDSSVVAVTQSEHDSVLPDFRNVPLF